MHQLSSIIRDEAGGSRKYLDTLALGAGALNSLHWLAFRLFASTCQGFREPHLLCQALPSLAVKGQVFICLAVSIVRWANVCSGIGTGS